MRMFRPQLRGKVMQPLPTEGCSWCNDGIDPETKQICGQCRLHFERMLRSTRWQKFRAGLIALPENSYCCHCKDSTGIYIPAQIADHEKPWSLFPSLFWLEENIQFLCLPHHNRKSQSDGSFTIR